MTLPSRDAQPESSTHRRRLPKPSQATSAIHFGLDVRSGKKYGLNIERKTYAQVNKRSSFYFTREDFPEGHWEALAHNYDDDEHQFMSDEWCQGHQARALENFDLNMAYYTNLDHDEFDAAIAAAVGTRKGMVEVTDLNEWKGKSGLYVMVLDDFCQVYVGVTESEGGVAGRIRQHWTSSKAFDRLLFGDVTESILSIDSFRALDTTRIFAAKSRNPFDLEDKIIQSLPPKFLTNRVAGGRGDMLGFLTAVGVNVFKRRELPAQPNVATKPSAHDHH